MKPIIILSIVLMFAHGQKWWKKHGPPTPDKVELECGGPIVVEPEVIPYDP